MNLFSFILTWRDVFGEISFQKKYIKEKIVPYLAHLEQTFDGKIPPGRNNKILNYYCLFVPSILCTNFRKLYGQRFTEKDRWSATLTGLYTPIFDDLYDDENLDPSYIRQLALFPSDTPAQSFSTNITRVVSEELIRTAFDEYAYKQHFEKLIKAQNDSLKQLDSSITQQELERITYEKGTYSFLYYHIHMTGVPDTQVAEALYEVGGLFQLCNDIFDVYKDLRGGIYTLVNTCSDFQEFKRLFLEKVKCQNRKIMALPYKKKNKEIYNVINLFTIARGLVAIEHLIKAEKKHGGQINWSDVERKDLIVDMEKPLNIFKWVRYTRKLSRLM